MVLHIDAWTKYLIVLCCIGLVAITAIVVVCFINPFCPINRVVNRDVDKLKKSNKKEKKQSFGVAEFGEPVELTKLNAKVQNKYGSPLPSYYAPGFDLKYPPPTTVYGKRFYTNTTTDSCYSSMSPTTEGGSRPTSPVSTVPDDADTSSTNSPPSITESDLSQFYGSLSVMLKYSLLEESNTGQLVINLGDAHNLPGREYFISTCDPFIRVVILKAKTRLRKSRSHYMILSEFQSSTIRRTRHPSFNESFTVELTKTDIKDCALKFLIFDRDKYVNPSQIAEVMCPLMELNLQTAVAGIPLSLELQEPRQNNGELLIGLSYLPTSERLSINVLRAMNLKYEIVTTTVENLNAEVRVLLLANGKLIKKKKTPIVCGSNSPNYDCSLSFDIPLTDLNQIVFIVAVAHRADAVSESDDSLRGKPSRHGSYIGKVFLGSPIQ
uniref:C2 domain-containing protein n=1 Tax=Strigamia maritima TaxID=126957 RepID=T1JCJ2_STRMM